MGLLLLIASSRILVWGAVEIAQIFGVSDMIIGLTIIAVGTSLPELASSVIAARKSEHDIALGIILTLGSVYWEPLLLSGVTVTAVKEALDVWSKGHWSWGDFWCGIGGCVLAGGFLFSVGLLF